MGRIAMMAMAFVVTDTFSPSPSANLVGLKEEHCRYRLLQGAEARCFRTPFCVIQMLPN
jgi:hypothetical protein